jgi:hypothetical protein
MSESNNNGQALSSIRDILEHAHNLAMEAQEPLVAIAIMEAFVACMPTGIIDAEAPVRNQAA